MELDPAVYTSKILKQQINSFLASTPMSKNVPMDHDDEPLGSPAVMAATPSVAACLSTHTAKCKWVLYAADCFMAQCHKVTCATCNGYVDHLINSVESGAVPSTPHNLAKALDDAWQDSMWDICEDARHELCQELDSTCHAYDKQKAQFNQLRSDYESLKDQLDDKWKQGWEADDEVSHLRDDIDHLETQICRYKGKARDSISTVMSISSSMKRQVETSPPPSTQPAVFTTSPLQAGPVGSATAPRVVNRSAPPIPKRPKWYDVADWHTDPDDNTDVEAHRHGFAEGMKYAQHVSTGPAGKKVKLVASLPIAITGMLPRPLGKTAAAKAWFDECNINDPALILLSDQAATILQAQHLLTQNTAYRRVEQHRKQAARTFAFPIDEAWPPNIKKWVTEWSMNPIGLPRPIRQDKHGLLNRDDIDVWLWLQAVPRSTIPREHLTTPFGPSSSSQEGGILWSVACRMPWSPQTRSGRP